MFEMVLRNSASGHDEPLSNRQSSSGPPRLFLYVFGLALRRPERRSEPPAKSGVAAMTR